MIAYVTLGTNDFERAAGFYDKILVILGAKRQWSTERFLSWGRDSKSALVSVVKPFDGEPSTVGNGVMVALAARLTEQVDEIHAAALAAGGTCEGPPGPRGKGFYVGYFRDLDGNKLNAFCFAQVPEEG